MSQVYVSITAIISILILLFGAKVYFTDKKNIVNRSFGIFTVSITLWLICDFLAYQTSLASYQLIINRVIFVFILAFLFTLAWFSDNFPKPLIILPKIVKVVALSISLLVSLISVSTSWIVKSITMENWGTNLVFGPCFSLFAILATILAFYAIFILVLKYRKFRDIEKIQVRYVLYGIGILLVLNAIFNMLVPVITHDLKFARFGTYSTILFVGFISYAILKARLFNLKIILTETAVVIINVILAIQIFSSKTITEGLLRAVFLMIVIYGSMLLLRSVRNEIKQREQLQALAKKLDKANQDLEELDEAKDNFLSMAAHELNTPIAAIEGYLSMILEEKMGGKIPTKAIGYLKNVFLSSKRLAGLVHDLLNVSRIESNRIHVVYAEAQIEDIIDQSIAEVKIKADEVGHKLTFEKPAKPLPKTYMDITRIVEVVINIIGNAIKYTDAPGKIVVKCHADDGKIVVAIEDNGRGIPKDRADHVFEKFTQVNVLTDQIKGSGLGMFISKNLIELHKGKLWFESSTDAKDHGTTFYFSLPIIKTKPFDAHEGEGALLQTKDKGPGATGAPAPDAKDATVTIKAPIAEIEKLTADSKEATKNYLGAKLEAEISIEGKKKEAKTEEKKNDKESEELIKQACEEAEKAPTTSLNETMSKLKD